MNQQRPIIPPFPQLPDNLIQFKMMVIADGVIITHELGVVDVKLKDLFAINGDPASPESYHPDLVEAAITSVQQMARKYNGDKDETANKAADETDQQQTNATAQGQSGNANEETGQIVSGAALASQQQGAA